MSFLPSPYQQAIFEWVETTNQQKRTAPKTLVIEASAGSGKTTTGVKIFNLLPDEMDSVFVAFNTHIAKELLTRLPQGSNARTYHSVGFQVCREAFGKVQVDQDKTETILKSRLDRQRYGHLYPAIKRLTSLCKAGLLQPEYSILNDLAFFHDIDLNGNEELVFDWVENLLDLSAKETNRIDFDDMIWLPLRLNLPCHKYEFLFIDELQDTNASQMELALRSVSKTGRIIGVGDRYQSIYAFRGADSGAVPNFIRRTDADVLPLSITYRNPRLIVNLVNSKFPEIPLEAKEDAEDGIYAQETTAKLLGLVQPGDMVLCRTNAPMIPVVFELIRHGKKAIIKGRDIGKGLQTFIRKFREDDLNTLIQKIHDYKLEEVYRLSLQEHYSKIQHLEDKVETVFSIADGVNTVSALLDKIDIIFSDEIEGIVFSSIHKAKGLEANRVYILRPDLLPHPSAKHTWMKQQERNIEYVALTRTLKELHIVS